MCGIAGIAFRPDHPQFQIHSLIRASQALRHRGPDDEGFLIYADEEYISLAGNDTYSDSKLKYQLRSINECSKPIQVGLVHRRLSIIDTSAAGHQPMCDGSKRYWIVYNGEIYNYKALREELKGLGYSFHTHTDTEVLLNAFIQWGTRVEEHLNGMWAFVIYDTKEQTLFASRDRVGVKPLYYTQQDNFFAFASEQLVFHKAGWLPFEINRKAVFDFLHHDSLESEAEGFFKHVLELAPSHHFTYDIRSGQLSLSAYYQPACNTAIEIPDTNHTRTHIEQVRLLVTRSISEHLQSDVPVGTCLSGGLDSSILVRVIHSITKSEQHSFHATFNAEAINESQYARDAVHQTPIRLHTVQPDVNDLAADLEKVIIFHQLPLRSFSSYAHYKVMETVAQHHIKVLLDGQGADELFGGYYRYLPNFFADAQQAGGKKLVSRLQHELFTSAAERKKYSDYVLRQYLKAGALGVLADSLKVSHRLLNKDLFRLDHSTSKHCEIHLGFNKRLQFDFNGLYLKEILYREDRNAMAHSIESRVPFADDVALSEYVFSIPGLYKIQHGYTKYLLREAFKELLPESIYQRKDKLGFASPNNEWMASMHHIWPQYMTGRLNEFLDLKAFKKFLNNIKEHKNKSEDYKTLKWLMFPVWLKVMQNQAKPLST